MTIRLYGKTLNKWFTEDEKGRNILTQIEIEYKEYDVESGELVAVGSEDFSRERYNKEIIKKFVWTWDGQKLNKGGHRWFELCETVTFRAKERKQIVEHLKEKYAEAALVQLR